MTTGEAALRYAARGWPVFPCAGKVPRTARGFKDASTDPGAIRAWWSRWPDAAIGLATGTPCWVLDVDPRHGGDDALTELERQHGALPDTARVSTGGGGTHVYFAPDARLTTSRGGLPVGLDVRGHGGYVILPPSVHPNGRTYQWEIGARPADVAFALAPEWLLDLILARGHGDLLRRDGTPLLIPEGERNHRLYQLACAFRRYGLGERALAGCLEAINRDHVVPPLGHEELARIAASAGRYAPMTFERHSLAPDSDILIARSLGVAA